MTTKTPKTIPPAYEAAYVVEYQLPTEIDDGISDELLRRISADEAFAKAVNTNSVFGDPFIAHQNFFYHQVKPKFKFEWENTSQSVRSFILTGLQNKAMIWILQKRRLCEKIGSIESIVERKRALKECNDELVQIWFLLHAFKCFDNDLQAFESAVDDEWKINPNLYVEAMISPVTALPA